MHWQTQERCMIAFAPASRVNGIDGQNGDEGKHYADFDDFIVRPEGSSPIPQKHIPPTKRSSRCCLLGFATKEKESVFILHTRGRSLLRRQHQVAVVVLDGVALLGSKENVRPLAGQSDHQNITGSKPLGHFTCKYHTVSREDDGNPGRS